MLKKAEESSIQYSSRVDADVCGCLCACASDVCACVRARASDDTARDCSADDPERAFGQSLYRVLTHEIE